MVDAREETKRRREAKIEARRRFRLGLPKKTTISHKEFSSRLKRLSRGQQAQLDVSSLSNEALRTIISSVPGSPLSRRATHVLTTRDVEKAKLQPTMTIDKEGAETQKQTFKIVGAKGKRQLSQAEVQAIIQEEAKIQTGRMEFIEPGKQEIIVGTVTRNITPTSSKEVFEVGRKTLVIETFPEKGYEFKIEGTGKITEQIKAEVDVPKSLIQAHQKQTSYRQAEKLISEAGFLELKGIEAGTLLSPKGTELIGSQFYGTQSFKKVLTEKLAEEIFISKTMPETIKQTQIRGITGALQSPPVEIFTSTLGGAGLGAFATKKLGQKVVSSTAGKVAIGGVGAGAIGFTAHEIDIAIKEGRKELALGLILTTGASITSAVAGFKTTEPKARIFGEKLKALTRQEQVLETKVLVPKKGFDVSSKQKFVKLTEQKTPLQETLSTKDLANIDKVNFKKITGKVELVEGTINIGKKTIKINKGIRGVTEKIKEPTSRYVLREKDTGKFFKFGKEVSTLRELGIKQKFDKVDKLIDVAGARFEKGIDVIEATANRIRIQTATTKADILVPIKKSTAGVLKKADRFKIQVFKGKQGTQNVISALEKLEAKIETPKTLTQTTKALDKVDVSKIDTQLRLSAPAVSQKFVDVDVIVINQPSLKQLERQTKVVSIPAIDVITIQPKLDRFSKLDITAKLGFKPLQMGKLPVGGAGVFAPITIDTVKIDQLKTTGFDTPRVTAIEIPTQTTTRIKITDVALDIPTTEIKRPKIPVGFIFPNIGLKLGGGLGSKKYGTGIIKNPVPDIEKLFKRLV